MLGNSWSAVGNPNSALGHSGSSFGPSGLAPIGIHHLLQSNLTTGLTPARQSNSCINTVFVIHED